MTDALQPVFDENEAVALVDATTSGGAKFVDGIVEARALPAKLPARLGQAWLLVDSNGDVFVVGEGQLIDVVAELWRKLLEQWTVVSSGHVVLVAQGCNWGKSSSGSLMVLLGLWYVYKQKVGKRVTSRFSVQQ